MKISEAIKQLQALQDKHGDVNVGYPVEGTLNRFHWPANIVIACITEYKRTVPVAIFTDYSHVGRALDSMKRLVGAK